MSDLPIFPPRSTQFELAAANRKLTTAILGMILLTGLVSCLSYLAGRAVTQARETPAAASPVIIEPLDSSAKPADSPPPEPPKASPDPVNAAPPAAASCPAAAGDVYYQVALTNVEADAEWLAQLKERGFPVKLAPVEGSQSHRVLVGPVNDASTQEAMAEKLKSHGYTFFRRRW